MIHRIHAAHVDLNDLRVEIIKDKRLYRNGMNACCKASQYLDSCHEFCEQAFVHYCTFAPRSQAEPRWQTKRHIIGAINDYNIDEVKCPDSDGVVVPLIHFKKNKLPLHFIQGVTVTLCSPL